jgi:hypothetical protein
VSLIEGHWLATKDGDRAALDLFRRHYSFHHYKDNRPHTIFVGPGYKMVLVTIDYKALFVWRKFIDKSGQQGINCAIFRNESELLSSDLIREADTLAWSLWPGERLYTYVDPRKIQKTRQPGRCFLKAGWHYIGHIKYRKDCEACQEKKRACGTTKSKRLIILEKLP